MDKTLTSAILPNTIKHYEELRDVKHALCIAILKESEGKGTGITKAAFGLHTPGDFSFFVNDEDRHLHKVSKTMGILFLRYSYGLGLADAKATIEEVINGDLKSFGFTF